MRPHYLQRSMVLKSCLALLAASLFVARADKRLPAPMPLPAAEQIITVGTKIQPGCTLNIVTEEEPSLTGNYVVRADGTVHFMLTDSEGGNRTEWAVGVKDKTASEAQAAIQESFKQYLREPKTRVTITRLPRISITVTGAAERAGQVDLPLGARVSEAVSASACKPTADLPNVLLLRKKTEANAAVSTQTLRVNVLAYQTGDSQDDPVLQNGDRLYIPDRPENAAKSGGMMRIVGEVNKEATIPVGTGMTVKDAFQRVGGLTDYADRKKVRLVRGSDGRILELDADKIEANDPENNVVLGEGDLILVGRRDRSMRYAIDGAVNAPAAFDYLPEEHMTLTKAIAKAGGIAKNGDKHKAVLRKGYLLNPAKSRDLPFDPEAVTKGKSKDWDVEPGDVVLVLPHQHRRTFFESVLPMALHFLPLPF